MLDIAGPWEVVRGGEVDGIFITPSGRVASIQVYQRRIPSEIRRSFWSPEGGASFDGRRLQIAAAGLDATFDVDRRQWTGTWALEGSEARPVVLARPSGGSGSDNLVGDWEGIARDAISGRIHIARSADDVITVWLVRAYGGGPTRVDRLAVGTRAGGSVTFTLPDIITNNQYEYEGVISDDGTEIRGRWRRVPEQSGDGGTLAAPETFRRQR
jgi:hypothetical protein